MKPERFPKGAYHKLHSRNTAPFKVLKHLGPKAYFLVLPPEIQINPIFYIEDLSTYHGHQKEPEAEKPVVKIATGLKPREEIEDILTDQIVFTRRGGFKKFLSIGRIAACRIVRGLELKKCNS